MPEEFPNTAKTLTSPIESGFTLTPHDVNALVNPTRAIWVGTAGNITLRLKGDSADVVYVGVPAGFLLPVRATHVRATGTTAGSMLGQT